ncbi:MAG: DUF4011 domain-containing protein [Eubacteriales bacterium]|nr:DUF4011 domain-containing protein [Eubacteriales bacterium]
MVLLKYERGSEMAVVACRKCARISEQVLKNPYSPLVKTEFVSTHTCPVCGEVYESCTISDAENFHADFERYNNDPAKYNNAVKDSYTQKQETDRKQLTQTTLFKTDSDNNSINDVEQIENFISVLQQVSISRSLTVSGIPTEKISPIEELDRKIAHWKQELLSTDKKNKMINYRETKRKTLKIFEPSAEELFNQLAVSEKTLTFQKPISKESDIRTYSLLSLLETLSYTLPVTKGDIKTEGTIVERERTLKNLRSQAKLAQEEQGTNILYLCFGFIYWREHNRGNSPWIKSPLLMMPVTLGLKSLNAPYTLTKGDDEIEVNPTLDYLFNAEYNIDLPTFELKNKSSFGEYLRVIEEIVDRRGWKVVPEVSLGLLSFLKISMYHDLNDNRELLINNPILRAMAGDRTAIGNLPADIANYDFDKANPEEWHEVVNSDSSQKEAILLSKMGVSFVMQGPPGTGKSQTITNIIAEALADGKKVLFVSEKAAALQVVLKRLTEVGLDDFCLSLHNYKANKKEIIDSIGANLNLQREYVGNSVLRELTELFNDRQYLNKYADELHQPIAPLGDSIYMAFGKLTKMENASVVEFSLEKPTEITKEQYAFLLYNVTAFEKALQNIDSPLTKNPWYGTKATSSDQNYKQELMHSTGNLVNGLRELDNFANTLNKVFHLAFDHTWNGMQSGVNEINKVLDLPMFTPDWMDAAKRIEMIAVAKYEEQEQKKYYAACDTFRDIYDESVLEAPVNDWVERINAASDGLNRLGFGNDSQTAFYSKVINAKESIKSFAERLKIFVEQYRWANSFAGIGENDTFANAETLYAVLKALNNNNKYVNDIWFDDKIMRKVDVQLSKASGRASSLKNMEALVSEKWHEGVYEIDASTISEIFCEGYSWIYQREGEVEDLLEREIAKAELLLKDIKGLLAAQMEAYALLHYSDVDSAENMMMLCSVLTLIADVPYMQADWFDARKNAEIMPVIEEAVKVNASINEKTAAILDEWEPSALSIDADGMLGRFKTEYVGFFRKMKAGYKEDIKTIRLHYKSVGKSIEEDHVIDFLQRVKRLNEEKKWFEEHSARLMSAIGNRYKGLDTDWSSVQHSIQIALQIAGKFPYGNIPDETIRAIISITESLQLTGDAKRLADELSLTKITKCVTDINSNKVLNGFKHGDSLRNQVIPVVEEFIKNSNQQLAYIQQLKKTKKNTSLTYDETMELLKQLISVNEEKEWFKENESLNQELFGKLNANENSDWNAILEGLNLVGRIKKLFVNGFVPEKTIDYICCLDKREADALQRVQMLSAESIKELRGFIQNIAPHLNRDDVPVEDIILNSLQEYTSIGDVLESVITAANRYSTSGNPTAEVHCLKLINACKARKLRGEILSRYAKNSELLGSRFIGIDTEWEVIEKDLETVENFNNTVRTVVTDESVRKICNSREYRDELRNQLIRLEDLVSVVGPEIEYFQKQFNGSDFVSENMLAVVTRYEACLNGFGELDKWLDYVETRAECDKSGLADFTAKIVAEDNSIKDICAAFERGFYYQWIGLVIDRVPSVQSFRRRVHEQRIERFISMDEKQFELSRKRIRKRIISTYPKTDQMAGAGSEIGILRHEMEKKRRIMPLRKLFKSIPNLLLTLKPCLMMSPLSVAYFLEAGLYKFDMVIFDEASQIFPQDAIGAIFRAKQVVIAGDTKQLPPTNFFTSNTGNNDEEYDDDDSSNDEIFDSILEETANILPNRTLLWHYRSKHEHLIAFSNKEIYKNELVTFPSSNEREKDTGVEFVYVEDGYYEGGGRNCNKLEAKRCVELIKEHIDRHPDRSLGIIAFSEKQQNAIIFEIDQFRKNNPEYESFFAEGKEDEFFVKNLENVQGDERDTIFFSVGYGKTKEQKANNKPMAMCFGPLGNPGGERRLNVAITRARRNIKLVSSILPSDIDLSRTESEGIRMLRAYIEFAMKGEVALASTRITAKPDEFVDAVADFLRNRGYKIKQFIGCSGYKIDIAVEHPSEVVQQFAAGIECDGFSYVSARTARDRDRLRRTVLNNMGWNMYRVWSAEWFKNPEIEGEKLIAFIESAIEECDKKVKAMELEKRKAEEARKRVEEDRRREQERKKAEQEAAERKRIEEVARKEAEAKAAKEAKRRLEVQRKADEERARREVLRRQWEEERKQKEAERHAKMQKVDVSWVKKDELVIHKSYGIGKVNKIKDGYIHITFSDGEKEFVFPDAFEKGFLSKPTSNNNVNRSNVKSVSKIGASKTPSELIEKLKEKQFTCIDNRMTSGILWVLYSVDKKAVFEDIIAGYDVSYKLERRGAVATRNIPAWRIMFN